MQRTSRQAGSPMRTAPRRRHGETVDEQQPDDGKIERGATENPPGQADRDRATGEGKPLLRNADRTRSRASHGGVKGRRS
jgi:hypothetical protein